MNVGILAKTLMAKILVQDPETGEYSAPDTLEGVPDWVQTAYENGLLTMTEEDDFSSVWVTVPGEAILGALLAVRASGNDILVNHGAYIGVMKEGIDE